MCLDILRALTIKVLFKNKEILSNAILCLGPVHLRPKKSGPDHTRSQIPDFKWGYTRTCMLGDQQLILIT